MIIPMGKLHPCGETLVVENWPQFHDTLMPRDLSSPMSPFSTAMNTDLRWLMSEGGRFRVDPKSSMV
jgi:hypothetical protein